MSEFCMFWVKKKKNTRASGMEQTKVLHTKFPLHFINAIFLEKFQHLARNENIDLQAGFAKRLSK